MQVGNRRVRKVLVGGEVVYRDSGGWVPLSLSEGVNGLVMFKDNNDGTASLIGSLKFYYVQGKGHELIPAPEGYEFTSIGWSANKSYGNVNGIVCLNDILGQVPPSTEILNTEIQSNSIYSSKSNASVGSRNKTLSLTRSSTVQGSSSASPAIVGIRKV